MPVNPLFVKPKKAVKRGKGGAQQEEKSAAPIDVDAMSSSPSPSASPTHRTSKKPKTVSSRTVSTQPINVDDVLLEEVQAMTSTQAVPMKAVKGKILIQQQQQQQPQQNTSSTSISSNPTARSISAKWTGADAGDILEGIAERTAGVKLSIVGGSVHATAEEDLREQIQCVAMQQPELTLEECAQILVKRGRVGPGNCPVGLICGHHPRAAAQCQERQCPVSCRFRIIQGQKLIDWAADIDTKSGGGDERQNRLQEAIGMGEALAWYDVLSLMGYHFLALDIAAFNRQKPTDTRTFKGPCIEVREGGIQCTGYIGSIKNDTVETLHTKVAEYGRNNKCLIAAPKSSLPPGAGLPAIEEMLRLLVAVIGDQEGVDLCVKASLPGLATLGQMKSLLQKVIRFGPTHVDLSSGLGLSSASTAAVVDARTVACVTFVRMLVHRGMFVPEIGKYTRGVSAAFKRLGVILFEDAWVAHSVKKSTSSMSPAAVFACALLAEHDPTWFPPESVCAAAIKTVANAVASPFALWRDDSTRPPPSTLPAAKALSKETLAAFGSSTLGSFGDDGDDGDCASSFRWCAHMLEALGSFAGDIAMVKKYALWRDGLPDSAGMMEARHESEMAGSGANIVMPVEHCIDQHAFRGIGHLFPHHTTDDFGKRFGKLFAECTGFNPRRGVRWQDADDNVQKRRVEYRRAQYHVARLTYLHHHMASVSPTTSADPKPMTSAVLPVSLQSSYLAAAVGPINVVVTRGTTLSVVLGLDEAEDERVFVPPTRESKKDSDGAAASSMLVKGVDAATALKAVARARDQPPRVVRLPLGGEGTRHNVHFDRALDSWVVDGRPWSDIVQNPGTFTVSTQEISTDDHENVFDAVLQMYNERGAAALPQVNAESIDAAKSKVTRWCEEFGPHHVLRVVTSFELRNHEHTASLPKPSLSGDIEPGETAVYPLDHIAYELFMRFALLLPGALTPTTPPTFKIKCPTLLSWLTDTLRAWVNARTETWKYTAADFFDETKPRPKLTACQLSALQNMEQRDASLPVMRGRHFVFMDPGLGKTATTSNYLREVGDERGLPRLVLWMTMREAMQSTFQELKNERTCAFRGDVVSLIGFKGVSLATRRGQLKEALLTKGPRVIVLEHDTARDVMDLLMPHTHEMALVVDECDKFYGDSKRTSAGVVLASSSPLMVCQTGTPVRTTRDMGLRRWLALTSNFRVSDKNWLVAAAGMVAHTAILDIAVKEETITVPFFSAESAELEDYNMKVRTRSWMEAAEMCWRRSDPVMAAEAVKRARADRSDDQQHRASGGVLLVCHDEAHVTRMSALLDAELSKQSSQPIRVGTIEHGPDPQYGIVLAREQQCRGFNWATRLGVIVRSEYPGNAATRSQLVGRLRRMGQVRTSVSWVTVIVSNSVVSLLHERHSAADFTAASLAAFCEQHVVDLQKQSTK
eukprot:PhM_4_TR7150/c0_g1_i1/m.50766